ncbi:MAG: hypothetical protein R3E68_16755 [Burkholderiaceae bacterium]
MLTLFIPDSLAGAPPAALPAGPRPGDVALPGGARLLAQHEMTASELRQTPWEAWLAERFGTGHGTPAAAWSLFDASIAEAGGAPAPQLAPGGQMLTACPAHLQAGLDHLVLHPPGELGLAPADAQALASAANGHFRDDGLQLQVLSPGQWRLRLARALDVDFASSHVATGRRLDQYMPAGPDARRLRALLNEMQMLWHEHPVNEGRRDRGEPPVNALWIEGHAQSLPPSPYLTVFSDQPTTRGLALAAGLGRASVISPRDTGPTALMQAVAQAAARGPTLVELDHQAAPGGLEPWLSNPALRRPINIVLTGDLHWQHWQCATVPWWRFWQRAARR